MLYTRTEYDTEETTRLRTIYAGHKPRPSITRAIQTLNNAMEENSGDVFGIINFFHWMPKGPFVSFSCKSTYKDGNFPRGIPLSKILLSDMSPLSSVAHFRMLNGSTNIVLQQPRSTNSHECTSNTSYEDQPREQDQDCYLIY